MRDVFALLALAFAALAQTAPGESAASYSIRGDQLFQKQLFVEAVQEYRQALTIDPSLNTARYQMAVCLFAVGRNDESLIEFQRLAKELSATPETAYYVGRLHILSGDLAAAIHELSALTGNSKIPEAPYYLALAFIAANDQTAGLKWLLQAAANTPHDYHVHYRLARLYSAIGHKTESEKEYQLYTQYRDHTRDTETQMRECAAALDRAENSAVCARLSDPNDPEKLVLLGQLYGSHAAYSEALTPLVQAGKLDPASFEAWQNLGISYFRLQRYADARGPLETALTLHPDNFDSLNLLAASLYMLGDDAAALPLVKRAHEMRPDDVQLTAALQKLQQARAEKE